MARLFAISEAASLGLHAAVVLAGNDGRLVTTRELAERLEASEAHLAKVLQRLARAGLVASTRGPAGGFRLARPAGEVSLLEVYETIEGPLRPTTCLFGSPVCGRAACIFGGFLAEFDERFRAYLRRTTLADLVTEEKRNGDSPKDNPD